MRYLFLILMLCPCSLDASVVGIEVVNEFMYQRFLERPCMTHMDIIEDTCGLNVRWKPRIRRK